RGRMWLTRGATIALVVIAIGLFAAAWYYSGEIARQVFALGQSAPDAGIADRMAFSTPEARGVEYSPVMIEGPLGPLSAWATAGDSDTWVVFVHDRGTDRREALRALPTATALGLPTLTITYRNDADAPPSSSGRHGYGRNEWSDLHAAVEFARDEGAERVVLVGYGSGGSIISVFMRESSLATAISGLVLDAPVLDVGLVVDRLAAEDRVPRPLLGWARAVATFRFGIDWSALDHLESAQNITIPVLVFHGVDDEEAPIEASRQFVEVLADLASLVEVPGAGHGEAWNVDPEAYEATLSRFLEQVSQPTGADDEP
ncbi:MAG: prolyl oligopeptidase family serine peptidase, partial [Acidimicrobiia bacterium]